MNRQIEQPSNTDADNRTRAGHQTPDEFSLPPSTRKEATSPTTLPTPTERDQKEPVGRMAWRFPVWDCSPSTLGGLGLGFSRQHLFFHSGWRSPTDMCHGNMHSCALGQDNMAWQTVWHGDYRQNGKKADMCIALNTLKILLATPHFEISKLLTFKCKDDLCVVCLQVCAFISLRARKERFGFFPRA